MVDRRPSRFPSALVVTRPVPRAHHLLRAHPQLETEIRRLKLRHTWTTTMSSSVFRDTVHLRYTHLGDQFRDVVKWAKGSVLLG
jgi:hypothetical protein